ncbi:MAG: histone deacetylase family protein [Myxococcales bacterium]|nr:histone deacetylase family protein [Myxococcales bacterium]
MFRIRRIYDDHLPVNQAAVKAAREILKSQFAAVPDPEWDAVFASLPNPFKKKLHAVVFVAEKARGGVVGAAVVLRDPEIKFAFLEYMAASSQLTSRGIGGALYETIREDARAWGAKGLFMECLPDTEALSPNPALRAENQARLKFYERYGARPLAGTAYETPLSPQDTDPPLLVFDGLGVTEAPPRAYVKAVVGAILERKYKALCPPAYVKMVLDSIRADPVPLRAPRYTAPRTPAAAKRVAERIVLTVNAEHEIHHVRERGYVEAPVRISRIKEELERSGLFAEQKVKHFGDKHVIAVHDPELVTYMERTCAQLEGDKSVYPYVFPIRNHARKPTDRTVLAGYYCIDTFTPLHKNAYRAARRATDAALTAAEALLGGHRLAYALVRPPGHHSERRAFGGFCYLNHNAIAANLLAANGRVAILDLDYHHGNGQQDIFYARRDVLTVSLHGDPKFAYPYFTGFADETGEGEGEGFNLNLPLPEHLDPPGYLKALQRALQRIEAFDPRFLVLALGLDTARGDPTGTWAHRPEDFRRLGVEVGRLGRPTVVVQEGGYKTRTLGLNARRFFEGLAEGSRW